MTPGGYGEPSFMDFGCIPFVADPLTFWRILGAFLPAVTWQHLLYRYPRRTMIRFSGNTFIGVILNQSLQWSRLLRLRQVTSPVFVGDVKFTTYGHITSPVSKLWRSQPLKKLGLHMFSTLTRSHDHWIIIPCIRGLYVSILECYFISHFY